MVWWECKRSTKEAMYWLVYGQTGWSNTKYYHRQNSREWFNENTVCPVQSLQSATHEHLAIKHKLYLSHWKSLNAWELYSSTDQVKYFQPVFFSVEKVFLDDCRRDLTIHLYVDYGNRIVFLRTTLRIFFIFCIKCACRQNI